MPKAVPEPIRALLRTRNTAFRFNPDLQAASRQRMETIGNSGAEGQVLLTSATERWQSVVKTSKFDWTDACAKSIRSRPQSGRRHPKSSCSAPGRRVRSRPFRARNRHRGERHTAILSTSVPASFAERRRHTATGIAALGPAAAGIKTVFLTHMHADHTAGYPDLILTPWILGRKEPIEVYGPKGLRAMTRHVLNAWKIDIDNRVSRIDRLPRAGCEVVAHEDQAGRDLHRSQYTCDGVSGAARTGARFRLSFPKRPTGLSSCPAIPRRPQAWPSTVPAATS